MNEDTRKQIVEVIETHKKMVAELQKSGIETLAAAAEAITKALKQNGRVYICGNGGSAAIANHLHRLSLPSEALQPNLGWHL